MKFITLFPEQYNDMNTYIYNTSATDFIFIPPAYTTSYDNSYYQEVADSINLLVAKRSVGTTNIWIGTPGIDMDNFSIGYTSSNLTDFLKAVYRKLSAPAKRKVLGGYMNQESFYGDMDYNNLLNGTMPANRQLKIMSQIRTFIKNGNISGTDFLWIPYYGIGANATKIIKDIGHAADKVQIFDYCIMQPGYVTNPSGAKGNFEGICFSIQKGKVCYRDGVPVIATKVSNTKIGFEIEYAARGTSSYQSYKDVFSDYRDRYPYGFYWSSEKKDMSITFAEINDFMNGLNPRRFLSFNPAFSK